MRTEMTRFVDALSDALTDAESLHVESDALIEFESDTLVE
jgi:hypothetical protein